MTALAAAIALSATPLLAQVAIEPVVTPTPVGDATTAPAAADPIAPEPAGTTAAADPLAAEEAPASPVRKATATKIAAKPRASTAQAASAAAAPAAASVVPAIAAPVDLPPVIEPAAAMAAPPVVADAPIDPAGTSLNDMLPVAGAGGLALVLLAGAGLAVRRRRRRARDAEDAAWQQEVESAAEPAPAPELAQPAFVAAVAPASAADAAMTTIDAPASDLPDGFDLSRFGFNVQQAYQGPTEDNPSLSLKHRLRRASGMDQQERKLDAEVEAATGESPLSEADDPAASVNAPAATPTSGTSAKGGLLFARDKVKPAIRPTYAH